MKPIYSNDEYLYSQYLTLVLDENTILLGLEEQVFDNNYMNTLLYILKLDNNSVNFEILSNVKLKKGASYKANYLDEYVNIFIIENIDSETGNIIILDYNNDYNVKKIIPINYPHLLDLVIEVK